PFSSTRGIYPYSAGRQSDHINSYLVGGATALQVALAPTSTKRRRSDEQEIKLFVLSRTGRAALSPLVGLTYVGKNHPTVASISPSFGKAAASTSKASQMFGFANSTSRCAATLRNKVLPSSGDIPAAKQAREAWSRSPSFSAKTSLHGLPIALASAAGPAPDWITFAYTQLSIFAPAARAAAITGRSSLSDVSTGSWRTLAASSVASISFENHGPKVLPPE